jgi:hypothetical protein
VEVPERPGAHGYPGVGQRAVLLARPADEIRERDGEAAEPDVGVGVCHSGERPEQQHPAALDDAPQVQRVVVVHEVQLRCYDQVVPGQVTAGVDDVDSDARTPERSVVRQQLVHDPQPVARPGRLLNSPPARPVEDERDARLHARTDDAVQAAQLGTVRTYRAVQPGVGSGVRDERRVEALGTERRLAPLEEAGPVRPARDCPQRVQSHPAGGLGQVVRTPVDRARRLLHEHPGRPASKPAHQVVRETLPQRGVLVCRVPVGIVRDDVDLRGPLPIVGERVEAHEVGRHGRRGCSSPHEVALLDEQREQLVGGEPAVVEVLRRVDEVGRGTGRDDLSPVVVALAPEGGSPRAVQLVDRAVPPVEPGLELRLAQVAVAHLAVLVADVPHAHGRVGCEPVDQRARDGEGTLAVGGRRGAEMVA